MEMIQTLAAAGVSQKENKFFSYWEGSNIQEPEAENTDHDDPLS